MPIVTHIEPVARLVTFDQSERTQQQIRKAQADAARYQSHSREARRAYNLEYRARGKMVKAAGSGQYAGLTYRAQLAREALAKSGRTLEAGMESGKRRKKPRLRDAEGRLT